MKAPCASLILSEDPSASRSAVHACRQPVLPVAVEPSDTPGPRSQASRTEAHVVVRDVTRPGRDPAGHMPGSRFLRQDTLRGTSSVLPQNPEPDSVAGMTTDSDSFAATESGRDRDADAREPLAGPVRPAHDYWSRKPLPSRIFWAYLSIRFSRVAACLASEKYRLYSRRRPGVSASNAAFNAGSWSRRCRSSSTRTGSGAGPTSRPASSTSIASSMYVGDGVGQPGHVVDRGEPDAASRARVRPLLLEHASRVVQQGALEEHQGEEVVHLLEDDDVPALVAVAGLAPLDLLGQPAAEQDRPQLGHLLRPLLRPRCRHRPWGSSPLRSAS